jgi:hypothetical protein
VVRGILLFPYDSTKGKLNRLEFNESPRCELLVCRQDMGTCGRWAGSFWGRILVLTSFSSRHKAHRYLATGDATRIEYNRETKKTHGD